MQTLSLVLGAVAFSVMMLGFLPPIGLTVTYAAVLLCAVGAIAGIAALRTAGARGGGPAIAGLTASSIGLVIALMRLFRPGSL